MSKIFCIVGQSACGKDTFYRAVLEKYGNELSPVIPATTRPMRAGERDGIDYHFVTFEQLAQLEADGMVIEKRGYNTVHGLWIYFTMKFDLAPGQNYILISTLEGAERLQAHYGKENVPIIFLSVDAKLRLIRSIEREARESAPDYREVCRRFLADEQDFAVDKIAVLPNLHKIDTGNTVADSLAQWDELYKTLKNS